MILQSNPGIGKRLNWLKMEAHHTPVMVREVVAALRIKSTGSYIDCTLGAGGHSLAILGSTSPPPRVLGIDLDAEALALAEHRLNAYSSHVAFAQGNFAGIDAIAEQHGFNLANGVLIDLGLSSMQVDTAARGFSFRQEASLDMRFDSTQTMTAHQIVNEFREDSLRDIISRFGEERRARRIASAIIRARPIDTTTQLANVVIKAVGRPPRSRIHPATRTFQAIRMTVNDELGNLERGLEGSVDVLGPAGRLVVISYHSLEDRLVKNFMRRESTDCICPQEVIECLCDHKASLKLINRRVITPQADEVAENPRSRSAKMRVAERI